MTSSEIRQKFLDFFAKRGHTIVPSSSLLPDDPSVLLTTAGMQQFKPYYGELDPTVTVHPSIGKPVGRNAVSCQKSFRTVDIDEVGDSSHLTFFEMLGNFSFGGYGDEYKKKAIEFAHDFIVKEMGLEIDYVTVFEGAGDIQEDVESEKIWKSIDPGIIVKKFGREDNFWGPTGEEGPCGPTTEIYVDGIEIWNIVFNQYYKAKAPELKPGDRVLRPMLQDLDVKGIDTGMGLERLTMVKQGTPTIFETDLFIDLIPDGLPSVMDVRVRRIMLDHCRAIVFLVSDGVRPSNKEQGYILRRLIRRVMVHFHQASGGSFVGGDIFGMDFLDIENLLENTVKKYRDFYPELNHDLVLSVFREENSKFRKAINNGVRELRKIAQIDAKSAFKLFESYGLTYEIIKDFAGDKAVSLTREAFDVEFKKHQEISKAGSVAKFGGHGLLLDTGELKAKDETELKVVTRLHTATHMLQQALREVLGPDVHQAGSDITVERTRFDFTFPRKLTPEEIKAVEDKINQKVREDLPMQKVVLSKSEAEKTGALYFFKEKYPDPVNVYFMGKDIATAWSKEFCGGPHVTHSGEVGKFEIAKEEACSAGVRRIRGIVE